MTSRKTETETTDFTVHGVTTETTETTDVAVHEVTRVPMVGTELFDMSDQMEGIEVRLPQIRIAHQAQMFIFPDGKKVETFRGVILDMNKANAYWAESFEESGGGTPPTCSSLDGLAPEPGSEDIQSSSCLTCPQNKFGSNKKGKACKNMKRIHVLIDGSMMPFRLTVPPSNLKAVDLYVSLLTSQGIPYQLIETEFSLRVAQNKEGVEYSELHLRNCGQAPMIQSAEDAQKMKSLVAQWKGVMRGEMITQNEI